VFAADVLAQQLVLREGSLAFEPVTFEGLIAFVDFLVSLEMMAKGKSCVAGFTGKRSDTFVDHGLMPLEMGAAQERLLAVTADKETLLSVRAAMLDEL